MSDADFMSRSESWPAARPSSAVAAAAAAERTESTRRRLLELQQRLERLRAGQASTREDVLRARTAAEAQRRACVQAQRRMATARAAWHRRAAAGGLVPLDGRDAGDDERYQQLREAFISLASSWIGAAETPSDQDRRRQLATALVERVSDRTRNWTEALCRVAVTVVPGATGSAVSTYDDVGVAHPVAAADDRSMEMEELQQVVGEGPGHAARSAALPVLIDDLAGEGERWPGYVSAARGHGITAVWSLPIMIEGAVLGSLSLYHQGATTSDHPTWPDAGILAGLAAASMIIDADLAADQRPAAHNPPDAVDLASGVLAVRAGVRVDQALALLRGHAFGTGRRISDVAADILAGRIDLG